MNKLMLKLEFLAAMGLLLTMKGLGYITDQLEKLKKRVSK